MPRLTVAYPRGQGSGGQGGTGGWDCKWMEGELAERSRRLHSSSNQTPAARQPLQTLWPHTPRTPRPSKGWYSLALVVVVWSVCQVEAPLHPSLLAVGEGWRLLFVCSLWTALGVGVHALRCCLRPGHSQGAPPPRVQQEVVAEGRTKQNSCVFQSRSPGPAVPLGLALADSLLLCVLQEPLPDPSAPHMKTLISRLEAVSHTLGKADAGSPAEDDSALTERVKLTRGYLQQRTRSLRRLVQVQGEFEASVKDMLEGLGGLWARLEELHTGVTLTKEGSRGHGDLASARTDAETLLAVLGHYRDRLQVCQAHLKDSTQLLQELTWSHTHLSNSVGSSSESVWAELLLQTNMEQFDKVQESFLSMEQQTSTFQAHLEGLGKGDHANGAHSCSASPQTSPDLNGRRPSAASLERRNSASTSTSVSSMDADTDAEADAPLSLCERSAMQFSSTIGRLRKSGRRK